jgi:hypothetical protein
MSPKELNNLPKSISDDCPNDFKDEMANNK